MQDLGNQTEIYEKELAKPVKRMPECEISFGLVNTQAMEDATLNTSALAPMSSQIISVERDYVKQYATLEPNFYFLDGTFVLPQESGEYDNLGVISNSLNNWKDVNVIFIINFHSPFDFTGLQITWNTLLNEYAESYKITMMNSSGEETIEEITNNEGVISSINKEYQDVIRITIEILKWNVSNRRARFERIEIGSYIFYTNKDLNYVEMLNESNPLSLQLPSNQLKFTIIDKNDNFNPDNPVGSYKYLTENSPIEIKWKEKVYNEETLQWEEIVVQGGVFYLNDWNSGGDNITYSFTGTDVLSLLNKRNFYKGKFRQEGISAKQLILEILEDAELPSYAQNKIIVDDSLNDIILYAPLPMETHKNCIQLIANACNCAIVMQRDGKVKISPLDNKQNDYLLDGKMIYDKFPRPQINNPVRGIECNIYNYNFPSDVDQILEQEIEVNLNENEEEEIILTHEAIKDSILSFDISDMYIKEINYYAYATIIKVIGYTGKINFILNGKKSEIVNTIYTLNFMQDGYIANPNGEVTTIDNLLITDSSRAKLISETTLEESLNRNIYELSARADLRLDPMDMIFIETKNTSNLKVRLLRRQYIFGPDDGFMMECEFRGGNY